MITDSYKPSYTWPSSIPFRIFYNSDSVRVFIIENIHHNWEWFKECHQYFKPSDYFFVIGGWYQSPGFVNEAEQIFNMLGLNKKNFFIMYNSEKEKANFAERGFVGDLINQNAWLKENQFKNLNLQKLYNAIYVGRRSAFKRHFLASKVNNLALIAGDNHGNNITEIPSHSYLNPKKLNPNEVMAKINESRCGLILSEVEGACFASSEYLLCGIPVVSTVSLGGRDVWYDDYNSIIVEPNPDAVANAVNEFVKNPRDPEKIIKDHIAKAEVFRRRFVAQFKRMVETRGATNFDANLYFRQNFTPKMRGGFWLDEIISFFKTGQPTESRK